MTLLHHPPLILASASPRRRDLLRQVGFEPLIEPADVVEVRQPGESPEAMVLRLARDKAHAVRLQHPEAVVLAADTVVVLGDEVLGKPRHGDDHHRMLVALSGQTHRVLTGVALVGPDCDEAFFRQTGVTFRHLLDWEIDHYVASHEGDDKAGGYAIQGIGAGLVSRIEGSYSNVVGLPLAEVLEHLYRLGIRPDWSGL
ncbi:MAG: septum formation inhibitor Maf [Alphaproteobacteria bacterium CG_4_10_14_0_2_um_filter_63_37]|nr:MAG: septum formation protein Maf [Proteobacteria bacterium CG1_02_64_396]PJA25007.1 MAG: septum formation inhibitor Maf [Alphaproteobacteria bacterium CG_4_10_14_0_2_um_filter_63_37]